MIVPGEEAAAAKRVAEKAAEAEAEAEATATAAAADVTAE